MVCALLLMVLMAGTAFLESPIPFLSTGMCALVVLHSLQRGQLALVNPMGPLPVLALVLIVLTRDLMVWLSSTAGSDQATETLWHLSALTLLVGTLRVIHPGRIARSHTLLSKRPLSQ